MNLPVKVAYLALAMRFVVEETKSALFLAIGELQINHLWLLNALWLKSALEL